MINSMRINQYVAQATGLSRRAADKAIATGHVKINGIQAELGAQVSPGDTITLAGKPVTPPSAFTYLLFNKPVGYVTSRNQQGSVPTIYDLLPAKYHSLKPVGRLDKDSSGLLLLTDDGNLAQQLAHPAEQKQKSYQVQLDKPLQPADQAAIGDGVRLEDGPSRLGLSGSGQSWSVTMSEGRNRQIRRTFEALGYRVVKLHRTQLGPLAADNLEPGNYREIAWEYQL